MAEGVLDPGHVGATATARGFEDVGAILRAEGQDSGHLASSAHHPAHLSPPVEAMEHQSPPDEEGAGYPVGGMEG